MTLSAAHAPFDVYLGQRGVTLNAGKIYIGVAGMDPETNPQAVFWDEAATIPAFQPLDVMGGFVMRNGSPARFYTADTFSIRVRDRLNAQVYYEQNAQTGYSLGLGNFLQAGVSAQTRNAQEKMREAVSVLDFVDKADQATAQNGTTNIGYALTRALAAGFGDIEFPWCLAGYNLGATSYTVGTGQLIRGHNQVLIKSTATTTFNMVGQDKRSGVVNLSIDMAGSAPGSIAIKLRTDLGVVWGLQLTGLRFYNCYGSIIQPAGGTYFFETTIDDVVCQKAKDRQIYLTSSRGFLPIRNTRVDNTITGSDVVTWDSIRIEGYIGVELYRVDVIGQSALTSPPTFYPTSRAIVLQGGVGADRFIWMERVRAESSNGPGISIVQTTFVFGNIVEAFGSIGLGISFTDVRIVQATNWYARGFNDLPGAVAGAHGFNFSNCAQINGINFSAEKNTGDGIRVTNTTDCMFGSVRLFDNTGYGIQEAGTSDRNTYTGVNLNNNAGGAYVKTGQNSRLSGLIVNGVARPDTPVCTFRATKGGVDQAGVVTATPTKVTFTTELLDEGGAYDAPNSRFTPPPGTYRLSASVQVTVNVVSGSNLELMIYKNGALFKSHSVFPGAAGTPSVAVQADDTANGTDYYEVWFLGAGAGNKTLSGLATYTTFSGSPL